ncbi:TIGR01906 family membrane protein [Arthrobacter globiformis]|uniref:TIGR01906 family membrane protein n=1 Tax=Arthrobacter globiformis TaxID=1665 RepID=UPI00277F0AF3|nr:TIGR01906 family membrane protein [Arthrobacter globiformis]MDQ0864007.1 integral membrane protein (TIGR01906 family) [Arthrobacter globiformis]
MKDNTPTPSGRLDPRLDPAANPALVPAEDTDEPAFEWMKPAPAARAAEGEGAPGPARSASAPAGGPAADPAAGSAAGQPESRADRKAAEAAAAESAETDRSADAGQPSRSDAPSMVRSSSMGTHYSEPLPTSALQVRPPQEEVERRNAQREQAARAKPVLPRFLQVLLAIFYPVILLVLAVRAVTSPLFLWAEYHRPGFPGDGYGFNADDRMTYGSYAVDYLSNWSGPRYLGELVNRSGEKLFKDGEVSHMADVKLVFLSAFGAGALLILISIIAIIYLRRRTPGGVRRGLFAGSIVTLVLIIGLGTLAALGWQQFFTEFHRIFFAAGSWTFALEDTLIRLFPGQFWIDAGLVIAALVLITAVVTLILTWPTRRRRGLAPARKGRKGDGADGSDVNDDDAPQAGTVRPVNL